MRIKRGERKEKGIIVKISPQINTGANGCSFIFFFMLRWEKQVYLCELILEKIVELNNLRAC